MDDLIKKFKIGPKTHFSVQDHDPEFSGKFTNAKAAKLLNELSVEMSKLQEQMYAQNKHSLLIRRFLFIGGDSGRGPGFFIARAAPRAAAKVLKDPAATAVSTMSFFSSAALAPEVIPARASTQTRGLR